MRKLSFVKFDLSLVQHKKTQRLADELGGNRVEAAGYIALVIAYAMSYGDDSGTINHLTDDAIEEACEWTYNPGGLMAAFTSSGVFCGQRGNKKNPLAIDPSLWSVYAAGVIERRAKDRERKAAAAAERSQKT